MYSNLIEYFAHSKMVSSISVYYSHTVKCFLVLLINTNNSVQHYSFVCIQLNGFKHCYVILIIQFNIDNLFAYSKIVSGRVNN